MGLKFISVDHLVGETVVRIDLDNETWTSEVTFHCASGNSFMLYHEQDCCESVVLEDICGDLNDLIGEPILIAEEVVSTNLSELEQITDALTGENSVRELAAETTTEVLEDIQAGREEFIKTRQGESNTWTFYRFATRKGWVDMRWNGESNGYYSESVSFVQQDKPTIH